MHIYTGRQHTDVKMEGGSKTLLFYWQLATKRIKLFKIPILGHVLWGYIAILLYWFIFMLSDCEKYPDLLFTNSETLEENVVLRSPS